MKRHPILFTGAMVRAILDGTKTQTRRLIKPQPRADMIQVTMLKAKGNIALFWNQTDEQIARAECGCGERIEAPYAVGDVLWVKETWAQIPSGTIIYRADADTDGSVPYLDNGAGGFGGGVMHAKPPKWKPSIFMPAKASRIDLEVTEVRAQRLQELSAEDCQEEGIVIDRCGCERCSQTSDICPADRSEYVMAYAELWNSINRKPGRRWEDNPFVWAYSFKRIK